MPKRGQKDHERTAHMHFEPGPHASEGAMARLMATLARIVSKDKPDSREEQSVFANEEEKFIGS